MRTRRHRQGVRCGRRVVVPLGGGVVRRADRHGDRQVGGDRGAVEGRGHRHRGRAVALGRRWRRDRRAHAAAGRAPAHQAHAAWIQGAVVVAVGVPARAQGSAERVGPPVPVVRQFGGVHGQRQHASRHLQFEDQTASLRQRRRRAQPQVRLADHRQRVHRVGDAVDLRRDGRQRARGAGDRILRRRQLVRGPVAEHRFRVGRGGRAPRRQGRGPEFPLNVLRARGRGQVDRNRLRVADPRPGGAGARPLEVDAGRRAARRTIERVDVNGVAEPAAGIGALRHRQPQAFRQVRGGRELQPGAALRCADGEPVDGVLDAVPVEGARAQRARAVGDEPGGTAGGASRNQHRRPDVRDVEIEDAQRHLAADRARPVRERPVERERLPRLDFAGIGGQCDHDRRVPGAQLVADAAGKFLLGRAVPLRDHRQGVVFESVLLPQKPVQGPRRTLVQELVAAQAAGREVFTRFRPGERETRGLKEGADVAPPVRLRVVVGVVLADRQGRVEQHPRVRERGILGRVDHLVDVRQGKNRARLRVRGGRPVEGPAVDRVAHTGRAHQRRAHRVRGRARLALGAVRRASGPRLGGGAPLLLRPPDAVVEVRVVVGHPTASALIRNRVPPVDRHARIRRGHGGVGVDARIDPRRADQGAVALGVRESRTERGGVEIVAKSSRLHAAARHFVVGADVRARRVGAADDGQQAEALARADAAGNPAELLGVVQFLDRGVGPALHRRRPGAVAAAARRAHAHVVGRVRIEVDECPAIRADVLDADFKVRVRATFDVDVVGNRAGNRGPRHKQFVRGARDRGDREPVRHRRLGVDRRGGHGQRGPGQRPAEQRGQATTGFDRRPDGASPHFSPGRLSASKSSWVSLV